jgi:two-component system CAI-1 autoinducer sensor kinase/phosphatase CqsS
MSTPGEFHPLLAPLESVKDQSLVKGQAITVALLVGHPLFYWIWEDLEPQPYESLVWRLVCGGLGGIAFYALKRYGASDWRAAMIYGVATAAGSVVLGSWFYMANGGNKVWLASLVALTTIYFSLTDWRVACAVTAVAYLLAYTMVPPLHIGVWAAGAGDYPVFDIDANIILAFCLAVCVLTRYTDTSMRIVQLRRQLRALGITAHEIRTPLAQVQLLSSAVDQQLHSLEPGPLKERQLHHLQRLAMELRQSCADANGLVDTTLANANPFRPFQRREEVSMGEAVRAAVAGFQRMAGIREPAVVVEIQRDFTVLADPSTLVQVLTNLLKNALKAVVKKHRATIPEQIHVTVDISEQGTVSVSDRGAGMSKQELARAFEPFYTGDELHGHGLGLTFCRAAVHAYGGSIDAQSEKDVGTSITIHFPGARAL